MRGGDAQPVGRSSPPWLVRASSFVCEEKGVAILEFALIVPVLLLIYFGTVEITSVMRNVRKVDILSRTIGDTLSQRTMATARLNTGGGVCTRIAAMVPRIRTPVRMSPALREQIITALV